MLPVESVHAICFAILGINVGVLKTEETLYDVQWLAQLALLVVVRVAVNPHQKRLWVHGPKLIHTMLPVVWR